MKCKISINTQSSIKIKSDLVIYVDPFKIKEETHDADVIFITHDHYDHFDVDSLNKVMKDNSYIIVPRCMEDMVKDFKNVLLVDVNNSYNTLNLSFKTVPSYNINKSFHPKSKGYVGYVLNINGEIIYIAGDTDALEENKSINCDIALIPIGGTFTMDYKEAAQFINEVKPKLVIPIHYGSIVGSKEDGEKFKELLDSDIECELFIK